LDDLEKASIWPPKLFTLLSAKAQEEGLKSLLAPIGCYLDAMSVHLDAAYVLAHMGLEAAVLKFASKEDHASLVQSKAWKRCCKALRPRMVDHVIEKADQELAADDLGLLHGRVAGAGRPPIRRVVDRYFARHSVRLEGEVRAELRRRNDVAHGYWMNPELEYEPDVDYRRLEIVLTLIAAAIATYVGYDGPLKGYDVDERGHRPCPSWWTGEAEVPRQWFEFRSSRVR